MPSYDERLFSPAAPLAHVQVRNPQTNKAESNVLMLIDSGADVTLFPKSRIEAIGIERSGASYELMGFDGAITVCEAVRADLVFLRRTFREQFLLIDQDVGILGRDILNHVCLRLDGPRLSWEEQPGR